MTINAGSPVAESDTTMTESAVNWTGITLFMSVGPSRTDAGAAGSAMSVIAATSSAASAGY